MIRRISYLFLLAIFYIGPATAQQPEAIIKPGTKIDYKFFLYGQTVAINMTLKSVTDSVQLDWNMKGYAFGSYLISNAGFENGNKINFVQPAHETILRLAPDETFAIISKSAFKTLKKDKKFVYNNTTYVLRNDDQSSLFKAGDRELKVLHVTGQEEAGDLWILDDPDFPLICQMKNNPVGINFTVTGIK
jgi:hypothetical protein